MSELKAGTTEPQLGSGKGADSRHNRRNRVREIRVALIIGCQAGETSLLTRAALTVAQTYLDNGLLAQEGALGTHLLSADIIPNPLMFGPGGRLEVSPYNFGSLSGFGISPTFPRGTF